jgi:hypothetical protein
VPPQTTEAADAAMKRVRERLDAIAEKAPDVPDRTWNKAWKKASESASSNPVGKARSG